MRTLTGPVTAGFHRVSWDLRDPAAALPKPRPPEAEDDVFAAAPGGPLVMPGKYTVTLAKRVAGRTEKLAGPVEFAVAPEGAGAADAARLKELREFQAKAAKLRRAVSGTLEAANELAKRLEGLHRALDETPGAKAEWKIQVRDLEKRDRDALRALRGDVALRTRNENTPPSIGERVDYAVESSRLSLAGPTATQREAYRIASEEFTEELAKLRKMFDKEVPELEKAMEASGAVDPRALAGVEGEVSSGLVA